MYKPILILLLAFSCCFPLCLAEPDEMIYELRTYHANPGQLPALEDRFRDHTVSLFEKHGMTNVAYWVPVENEKERLIYLLSFPSIEAREAAWKAFGEDPAWQVAKKASEVDGKLVAKIDSVLMQTTDFSGDFAPYEGAPRFFEMRTYTAAPGMLSHIQKRFRDHTTALFAKHGMTNLTYFELLEGQEGAENLLIYFLAHKDAAARDQSFQAFRADPKWQQVAKDSEVDAGGSILVENGVESLFLKATDYSPVD